ncbi:hypothetical protein AYK25_07135 [Thermoplasmatales archaeon SM1-50]|nr:MAG: hypothetical protein AYK25_07135 [Thermoplasmatales archaeon SM1-50]
MGETTKKDLGYYSIEIIKDSEGSPLVIVKFKSEGKSHWSKDHSWCPTLAELEFLYKTTKIMEKNTAKIPTAKPAFVPVSEEP